MEMKPMAKEYDHQDDRDSDRRRVDEERRRAAEAAERERINKEGNKK